MQARNRQKMRKVGGAQIPQRIDWQIGAVPHQNRRGECAAPPGERVLDRCGQGETGPIEPEGEAAALALSDTQGWRVGIANSPQSFEKGMAAEVISTRL